MTYEESILRDVNINICSENLENVLGAMKDCRYDIDATDKLLDIADDKGGGYIGELRPGVPVRVSFGDNDGVYFLPFEDEQERQTALQITPYYMSSGSEVLIRNMTSFDINYNFIPGLTFENMAANQARINNAIDNIVFLGENGLLSKAENEIQYMTPYQLTASIKDVNGAYVDNVVNARYNDKSGLIRDSNSIFIEFQNGKAIEIDCSLKDYGTIDTAMISTFQRSADGSGYERFGEPERFVLFSDVKDFMVAYGDKDLSLRDRLHYNLEPENSRESQLSSFIETFPELADGPNRWKFFEQTSKVSITSYEGMPVAKIEFEDGAGCLLARFDTEGIIPDYHIVPFTVTPEGIEFPGNNSVFGVDDWGDMGIKLCVESSLIDVKNGNIDLDPELKNNIPQFAEFVTNFDAYDSNSIRYNCDYTDLQSSAATVDGVITICNGVIDEDKMKIETGNPNGMIVSFENGRALNLHFDMDEYSNVMSKVKVVPFVVAEDGSFVKDSESNINGLETNKLDRLEEIVEQAAQMNVVSEEEITRLIESREASIDNEMEF